MRLARVAVCCGFIGCLAALAGCGGEVVAPHISLGAYVLGHLLLYLLVFKLLPGADDNWLTRPGGIVVVAILLRLLFLPYPLSDDVNRYAWEGHALTMGINPYRQAPEQLFAEYAASDPLLLQVNHPDISAAYPPAALMVFAVVAAIGYRADDPAATLYAFKMLAVAADILTVLLLCVLVRRWRCPPLWLALYAWNPLVLVYGAGKGHLDVLQTLWLAASLVLLSDKRRWAPGLGFACLGLAAATKYFSLIVLPFVVTRRNWRWLPAVAVGALPLCWLGQQGITDGLWLFASEYHYNDFLPRIFRLAVSPRGALCLALVTGAVGLWWIWLLKQGSADRGLRLGWMWMLLCLPTLHPWYLMPLLLLLVRQPSRAWMAFSAALGLQFLVQHHYASTGTWACPAWIWMSQYGVLLTMLLLDHVRVELPWRRRLTAPRSLDIVIPTLNEASTLPASLAALETAVDRLRADRADGWPVRVYLVDGGSSDQTLALAADFPVTTRQCPRAGRGQQFAAGIETGSGDVALMLHADARIRDDALVRLYDAFAMHPSLQWGILGHVYDGGTFKMRLIELSNRLRFHFGGVAFGDQGIFVRRDCLTEVGGMPRLRLMEDVELSLRLSACPARLSLGHALSVSMRRWQRKRFTGYTLQVLHLVTGYLLWRRLGADLTAVAERLYARYYRRSAPDPQPPKDS